MAGAIAGACPGYLVDHVAPLAKGGEAAQLGQLFKVQIHRAVAFGRVFPTDPYLVPRTRVVHLKLASQLHTSGLTHCNETIDPVPVIVPPTWNKTDYNQALGHVWRRAARELSDAENIIVIG